ncbi:MAG TPA: FixH family protein [Bryobacteraceae bacterium]|nr:FixH family protein [Bryobacteraceae bacterium]
MKRFALLFCAFGLLLAQDRPGNYTIRFEPTARLQTDAEIPFHIRVTDDRDKPLRQAKVTLTIENSTHDYVKVLKAPAIDEGVYVAKPVFPTPGTWDVRVDVRWNNFVSAKTEQYNVPRSTEP